MFILWWNCGRPLLYFLNVVIRGALNLWIYGRLKLCLQKLMKGGRVIRGVPWEKYCHLLKTTECTKWFLYINSNFFFKNLRLVLWHNKWSQNLSAFHTAPSWRSSYSILTKFHCAWKTAEDGPSTQGPAPPWGTWKISLAPDFSLA